MKSGPAAGRAAGAATLRPPPRSFRTSASTWRTVRPSVTDEARDPATLAVVRQRQQRAPVALGELAALDHRLHLVGQVEQAQQVGDGDAAATDQLGDALVREAELVDESRVGERLLDGVEVLAGDVLGQRDLERRDLVGGPHERRDVLEAGELRGAQAPLAGDQLEAHAGGRRRAFGGRLLRVQRPHHDRLHHAERPDGGGQLLQLVVRERAPRLPPVDADVGQRQLPQPALAERRRGAGAAERRPALADERPEALAQRLLAGRTAGPAGRWGRASGSRGSVTGDDLLGEIEVGVAAGAGRIIA